MNQLGRRTSVVVALSLVILGVVAPAAAAGAPGAETPEALVARMQAAAADEDLGEMVACLTPRARTEMSAAMFVGAAMMVAFSQMGAELGGSMAEAFGEGTSEEEKAAAAAEMEKARLAGEALTARFEALSAKYALEMPEDGAGEMEGEALEQRFASIDHAAFVTDVVALMESLGEDGEEGGGPPAPVPVGELTGLAVDGDRATGTVDGQPVEMVRIDGRWYFEPEETTEPPGDGI